MSDDTKVRSFSKSVTWRLLGILNGLIIAYLLVGDFEMSLRIALWANFTGFIAFYIHERIWNNVKWGKNERRTSI